MISASVNNLIGVNFVHLIKEIVYVYVIWYIFVVHVYIVFKEASLSNFCAGKSCRCLKSQYIHCGREKIKLDRYDDA